MGGITVCLLLAGCATEPNSSTSYIPGAVNRAADDSGGSVPAAAKLPDLKAGVELPDLLAYAALKNPGLEAAFDRWKASLERVPQAKSLPDPRFTYRYFIEEVETRVGAQRQSFGIAQTFPWFGKLELRGDAASEAANAERQRYESAKLELFYQVKDAYYEYYYLWRTIAVTQENMTLLKHIEGVARARYKAATAEHADVIRAQVELGKLDDRLRTLRSLRGPIVAKLNAALNRPAADPLAWPGKLREEKVSVTDEQILDLLERNNPELKELEFESAMQRLKIDLAKKNYFPDVTVGVDYIDTADSTGGRRPGDDGKDPVVAMVSVNLPIWRDKLDAGVRQARYRYWEALRNKEQRKNSLRAEIKMVLYRFRDAERKMNLYRDTLLPKARESLKATEASFRAGKGGFVDLIDAQRILLEFELALERALVNHAQRLAELEMLVGRELPRVAATDNPSKE